MKRTALVLLFCLYCLVGHEDLAWPATNVKANLSTMASGPTGTTLRQHFTGQEDQWPDFSVSYTDFGARQYNTNLRRWMVPDPMGEAYYDISPYVYCAGDPVNLRDREGNFLETAWDAANIALDVASFRQNIKDRKVGAAIIDALGLTADVIGAAAPFVPAGAGAAIKAARAVDKTAEVARTADKVSEATKVVDNVSEVVRTEKTALSVESWTKWSKNLRRNMTRASGEVPEGMHAHHILPKKFERQFKDAGVDINDPQYGRWMEPHHHLSKAKEYNDGWKEFFISNKNPTAEQVEEEATLLMKRVYGE